MDEDFLWVALYTDGSCLAEGPGVGFAHVDLARLAALELVPQRPGLPHAVLELTEGMRPIFFRRRRLEVGEGYQVHQPTVTVLGFQRTVGGRNVKSLAAHFSDGSVKITDDDASF